MILGEMPITKAEIEKALDELIDDADGFRFQNLATVLAKEKWPSLVASEPRKDLGADALISATLAPDRKGLASCMLNYRDDRQGEG
jgi:hypothetical protein